MLTKWFSANAVRFIGSQRFSITIENEVSTSSATTRLRPGLGLGDLDVVDGDAASGRSDPPVPASRSTALVSVRVTFHGSVSPNCPRPRRPGQLTRGPGTPGLAFAVAARKLLRHIAQRGLAELAHRLGRQPPLAVGAAIEEALVHQRLLQLGQRPGVDGGLVAQLAGQHVQVDVVHGGAGIALRKLLGQLLELADIGQRLGALPHAHRVVAGEPLASPFQSSPGRAACRCESSRSSAFISDGEPNACCANASSSAR